MLASRKGSTSQVAGRITSTRGRDAGNSLMKPPPIPSKGPKASAPTYIRFVYSQCVSDSFNKYGIVLSREPEFKYPTKDIWIRGLPEMYRDMIYFQDFHQRLQTMKLLQASKRTKLAQRFPQQRISRMSVTGKLDDLQPTKRQNTLDQPKTTKPPSNTKLPPLFVTYEPSNASRGISKWVDYKVHMTNLCHRQAWRFTRERTCDINHIMCSTIHIPPKH